MRTRLIKFFVRILGALTPPPSTDDPVTNIPLHYGFSVAQ